MIFCQPLIFSKSSGFFFLHYLILIIRLITGKKYDGMKFKANLKIMLLFSLKLKICLNIKKDRYRVEIILFKYLPHSE